MSNAKTFQEWAKEILPIVEAAVGGAVIEFKQGDVWCEKSHNDMCCDYEYRVKPKTIRIGEYDVPEPMREAPAIGTTYYIACTMDKDLWDSVRWYGGNMDAVWLSRGLVHNTKEAAVRHSAALVALTQGK